jgi:hypothetical protein
LCHFLRWKHVANNWISIGCSKYKFIWRPVTYMIIHVRWRAWPSKNATQNTFYKAYIVCWWLKIKSGIQEGVLLVWKVYLSLHFSFICSTYLKLFSKIDRLTLSYLSITLYLLIVSHLHPAARQFCRSTYTIADITIK